MISLPEVLNALTSNTGPANCAKPAMCGTAVVSVTTSRAESANAPTGTLTVMPASGASTTSGASLVTTAVTTGRVGLTGGWPRPEA